MDWPKLLDDNQIEYVSRGPNTRRGEISISCPWCGDDDPSQHLGISLATGHWGCLRDSNHRGRTAPYLIAALLGCSQAQARLVAAQYSRPDPDTLEELMAALDEYRDVQTVSPPVVEPSIPIEFEDILPRGLSSRFYKYLKDRKFKHPTFLIDRFNLMCAQTGPYKDRIIIPVYNEHLVGWTARAIGNPKNAPRYLESSPKLKTALLHYDSIKVSPYPNKILFVTEGPFDAMKIDMVGWPRVRATCTFGVNFTVAQCLKLVELSSSFERIIILFDAGATGQAFQLQDWLSSILNVEIASLPPGVKDPGEMTEPETEDFIANFL